MRLNKEELKLLEDGLGWLLDQTNDESWKGNSKSNMKWKNAEKLQKKIVKGLK